MNAVIDTKGRVVIPDEVRKKLGLSPGSLVAFDLDDEGRAHLRKTRDWKERRAAIESVVGSLKVDMTTDEVMALTRGED